MFPLQSDYFPDVIYCTKSVCSTDSCGTSCGLNPLRQLGLQFQASILDPAKCGKIKQHGERVSASGTPNPQNLRRSKGYMNLRVEPHWFPGKTCKTLRLENKRVQRLPRNSRNLLLGRGLSGIWTLMIREMYRKKSFLRDMKKQWLFPNWK